MFKRYPVIDSQFMKVIRDVHSFFREESLKIRNIQPVVPLTAVLEHVQSELLGFWTTGMKSKAVLAQL
jgi:hypothetical protein